MAESTLSRIVGQWPAGLHVAQRVPARDEIVEAVEDVVAGHQPDPHLAREPQPPRHLEHRLGASARIHAAGIGGDPDAALPHDVRQDPLHQRNEVARVAGLADPATSASA